MALQGSSRRSVHLRGTIAVSADGKTTFSKTSLAFRETGPRPSNPSSLLTPSQIQEQAEKLAVWLSDKKQVLVLTGAGISTESGIPDYRGHKGAYHEGHKPMVHDQFVSSAAMRQRYWGRSMMGYREFASRSPNEGHFALAQLQAMGRIGVTFQGLSLDDNQQEAITGANSEEKEQQVSTITQNVDALHQQAGSSHVVDLHGRGKRLVCLQCGSRHCRNEFHDLLERENADWLEHALSLQQAQVQSHSQGQAQAQGQGQGQGQESPTKQALRPDGDAEFPSSTLSYESLHIPSCPSCSTGILKPDVVFFGDSVPPARVRHCFSALDHADGLLCVGSSLAVQSAFRFVDAAARKKPRKIPLAILNVGETRAEKAGLQLTKMEAPIGVTLTQVVKLFGGHSGCVKSLNGENNGTVAYR